MTDTPEKQLYEKQLNLLLSILSFETYWAYFSMSSGNVYMNETKAAARQLIDNLEELHKFDRNILNPRKVISKGDKRVISEILDKLRKWSTGKLDFFQPLMQSRVMLWYLFAEQKGYLAKKLGLTWFPPIALATQEFEYTQRYLRWYPHLPRSSMWEYDQILDISRFGATQTVVVYGDIRRSQDLMIYTIGPKRFEEMIITFFESVRKLFDDNLGIFDKFTGDGFLGYFNDYLCGLQGKDYLDCFIRFSKQCMETSYSLFNDWKKWLRKLPAEDVMLSIGADVGQIHFGDQYGHLVCVGDAIVWAQRMCAAAPAGTVYTNNILANLLNEKKGIEMSPVAGKTKTGESFLASRIQFT